MTSYNDLIRQRISAQNPKHSPHALFAASLARDILLTTSVLCFFLSEMSGLVKPKKYDWKDSNLALFGSDLEKKV